MLLFVPLARTIKNGAGAIKSLGARIFRQREGAAVVNASMIAKTEFEKVLLEEVLNFRGNFSDLCLRLENGEPIGKELKSVVEAIPYLDMRNNGELSAKNREVLLAANWALKDGARDDLTGNSKAIHILRDARIWEWQLGS